MCFYAKNIVNTPFFRRKVCQRTYFSYKSRQKNFPPSTSLCFNKAFKVPRNFSRKVSCVGVWGEATTYNASKKARQRRAFLYCRKKLELRSKLCFKRLFEKSPLKIRKNFAQTHHFVLTKLLKFQETFLEKFLASGFGAEAPTDNAQKKHGVAVLFYIRLKL